MKFYVKEKKTNNNTPNTKIHKIRLYFTMQCCVLIQLTKQRSCAAKLTCLSSQKVNAGILLLTLQLTWILQAKGSDISLSLVNMITVASECQVLAKDKLKSQSITPFRKGICHSKQWFTFLCFRFFPIKREVQNTHYKTLSHVKFACLWGWTSLFTEARNRSNTEI